MFYACHSQEAEAEPNIALIQAPVAWKIKGIPKGDGAVLCSAWGRGKLIYYVGKTYCIFITRGHF